MSDGSPKRVEGSPARTLEVAAETPRTFLEFFAGGGMARLGLGDGWRCLLANDIDPRKGAAYRANFGARELRVCDVAKLTPDDIPGCADLAWSSAPCQDISAANAKGAGLDGARSVAFWPFWRLIEGLASEGRAPKVVVLENVDKLLSSNEGRDIAAVRAAYERAGYAHAAAIIDAKHFVPQSRPRIFVVAAHESLGVNPAPLLDGALLALPKRNIDLADVLDLDADRCLWEFPPDEVERCLAMMSQEQRTRLNYARSLGRPIAGPFAKRMRGPESGERKQRVEVRFDGLANAVRVAETGGSSKTVLADRQRRGNPHAGDSAARGGAAHGPAKQLCLARQPARGAQSVRRRGGGSGCAVPGRAGDRALVRRRQEGGRRPRGFLAGAMSNAAAEMHMQILGTTAHESHGRHRIGLPSKPRSNSDGCAERDPETEKILYMPIILFDDRRTIDAFSARAVEAVLASHPRAFDPES